VKTVPCLYTATADFRFLIDRHPAMDRVIVASPCSGHGFKHSAAIGEALAQWVSEGRTDADLRPFRLAPG
jgi:sarcosine oxidase